jgi:enediyne biosynthesis protein E4
MMWSSKFVRASTWIIIALAGGLIACKNKRPMFEAMLSEHTGIKFINQVSTNDSLTILSYPYLFAGAGVAVGDVNNDGLDDVFFVGNRKASNKLYLNKGNFSFDDISDKSGVAGVADWSTGVCMADVNGDGWLDIYVSTVNIPGIFSSTNELYINNKNNTFTEDAATLGLNTRAHTTQSAFFDYDGDGDLDCFMLNHAVDYHANYQDVGARLVSDSFSGSRLFRNDNGHFQDVTIAAGIHSGSNEYGLGIAVTDFNNDGWPDIYVSNDFQENDFCYINEGNGKFCDRTSTMFGHVSRFSMGNDAADYNNDGWEDLMTLDMLSPDEKVLKTSLTDDDMETYNYRVKSNGFFYQISRNCLQTNIGGQYFSDRSLMCGVAATDWSWAPLLADFDNDGYKDLFVSNGFKYRTNDLDFNAYAQSLAVKKAGKVEKDFETSLIKFLPKGAVHDYFFLNKKGESFSDVSDAGGFVDPTLSNGAAYADLDNDGDLDLIVNRIESPAGVYRNESKGNHFLNIRLQGKGLNTSGIGAMVRVYHGPEMQQLQQFPVKGFMSTVTSALHFGVARATIIDSICIRWPNGSVQRLQHVRSNQTIILNENNATHQDGNLRNQNSISVDWINSTDSLNRNIIHREDDFDDFSVQPLLPHSFATEGPKLAMGDVNSDGSEDVFLCGAKNQPGTILVQTIQGQLKKLSEPDLDNDSAYEDTNAIFFDADNDGDVDLCVCSGGAEKYGHDSLLNVRLYRNDGRGAFSRDWSFPPLFENMSCVRAGDFDKDGDLDLFVGGRVNARSFGYPPSSVILRNNGKGGFSDETGSMSKDLSTVGMLTDACVTDINRDGWTDLIVVGEWMPITVFINRKGVLEKDDHQLQHSSGLWQCIFPADVDQDGDTDFLVGNWGLNSKLQAPLKIYLNRWNDQSSIEPILCIEKDGSEFPFYGKTELERRMPFLKKQFLLAKNFAGKTMQEVFSQEKVSTAKILKVETMTTSLLRNDGGVMRLEPLPMACQAAPVFAFTSTKVSSGKSQYCAAGNFYGVQPYEGRYDGMLPCLFHFDGGVTQSDGFLPVHGAVRDLKFFQLDNKPALLIAQNNDTLLLFKKEH